MKSRHALSVLLTAFLMSSGTVFASGSGAEKAESQALFKKDCAMCHGQDAKGNTPIGKKLQVPDLLAPEAQKKTDAQLTEIIQNGKQKMPAFQNRLKPEQVQDLVSYIRHLAKPTTTGQK